MLHDLSTVEVETSGGVVYEVEVPGTVAQRLPPEGSTLELRTVHVVREDSVALYGFLDSIERELFRRLLTTSGVGAKLALAMLSTFTAPRLAQALLERDVTALRQIPGVGTKKAERLALELSEKVADLAAASGSPVVELPAVGNAVAALVNLGFSPTAAEEAVRYAVQEDPEAPTEELIRKALAKT